MYMLKYNNFYISHKYITDKYGNMKPIGITLGSSKMFAVQYKSIQEALTEKTKYKQTKSIEIVKY